jgi:hypothetical protein
MTIDRGGSGLLSSIKTSLIQDGWKLAVDRGPSVTETVSKTKAEHFDTFKTRYRMSVSFRLIDEGHMADIVDYDLSIVDNNTGQEVLTMSGRGEDYKVAELLMKAIASHSR